MRTLIIFAALLLLSPLSFAENGLITVKSQQSFNQTIAGLEKALQDKGMTIFAKIDHQAGAKKVDLTLMPAVVIIFGNPKIGTNLMTASPTVAIDLPQKVLIWEDKKGQIWYTYNHPTYLVTRHKIKDRKKVVSKIEKALANFAQAATEKRRYKQP